METANVPPELNCCVYTAGSVQQFLEYLLPDREHWNSARRGDLAYRGQGSSDWPLTPKAFRRNEVIGYNLNPPRGGSYRVTRQARAEFDAVHEFVKAADASGLHITETGARILLQEDPGQIFRDRHWQYSWPQEEVLEALALAQHHGVATRLLDFTEDPLVGAYFAASAIWDSRENASPEASEQAHLAVWVVDLRFIRAINRPAVNRRENRYPERIGEVRVPRANNSYLNAQSGFFLMDRGANDLMRRRVLLTIDKATVDRARFWHTGDRLERNNLVKTWFDETPVRQVRLPTSCTGELLRELANHGVTKGRLMPSLDRVVESLEFQRSVLLATDTARR